MDDLLTFDPFGGSSDEMIQKMAWQRIGLGMRMLAQVDLAPLIESIELGDAFGPFLDPTAYMNAKHDERRAMRRLAELLGPAVEHWRENCAPLLDD